MLKDIKVNVSTDFVVEESIKKAIAGIDAYITQITGVKPTQQEIAKALGKFFVLKEIVEFVKLDRSDH